RTATELLALLGAGEITSEQLTLDCLRAVRERDDQIRAFLHVDEADTLAQARAVDAKRARSEADGGLGGVPGALTAAPSGGGQPGRTCFAYAARRARAAARAWRSSSRPLTPPSSVASRPPTRSCWARPTATSSRWAPRRRTAPSR